MNVVNNICLSKSFFFFLWFYLFSVIFMIINRAKIEMLYMYTIIKLLSVINPRWQERMRIIQVCYYQNYFLYFCNCKHISDLVLFDLIIICQFSKKTTTNKPKKVDKVDKKKVYKVDQTFYFYFLLF